MIQLEHLSKRFGSFTAVHDLCLDIAEGEIFGFLGPNGAGKTTTIRMMMGLLEPTAGTAVRSRCSSRPIACTRTSPASPEPT